MKKNLQLYIFTANFKTYGTVTYLWYQASKDKFKTNIVMSKYRLS